MQPYSDYEIAQRRIAQRRANKSRFQFLLAVLGVLMLITLVSGESIFCTIPIGIITALFALSYSIELYYTNPERTPSEAEIEQEMDWLFGENWQEDASAQAHALAQDRIRERRISKWKYYGHLLLYIAVNGLVILSWNSGQKPQGIIVLLLAIWFFVFIYHARSTFPTKQMLEEREREYGETMRYELTRLQSSSMSKPKEKLKAGVNYMIGDDGELVEVEDEIMRLEDKPKREMGNQ